ncbi:MAG: cysteine--tRNA ligase [Actinomycetaceae bacterium]|nr:cysteine--tRNA ligase [Actinomycetaceae bacterium]
MTISLYDTATQKVRPLEPVREGHVGIYVCGATVQGSPHIGHMRCSVAFDVLRRWLERSGYDVTLVRNVTDIDDKILNKSAEANQPYWAWAAHFEREFSAAYDALGILPVTYEPRATGHIPDQIDLIQRLVDAGHAYADGKGNVYFDVHSLPDYGSLTHQKLEDMSTTEDESQIDAAIEAGKRDPRDFALWKATKPTEPDTAAWDSPWGRGRPGWHLECSAMSRRYLGDEFDIHGGGIDLRFPHHENEQAQSHGAGWGFARTWMHNAWVTIKGEKMSKSLGNSLVVAEILKHTPAHVLRVALGCTHYRSTVEYSEDTLAQAAKMWDKFDAFLHRVAQVEPSVLSADIATVELPDRFCAALDDDLNVAGAIACVHAEIKTGQRALKAQDVSEAVECALRVRAMLDILGIDPLSPHWNAATSTSDVRMCTGEGAQGGGAMKALDVLIHDLLEQRSKARQEKDWASADAIRDKLATAGIVVEDSADGPTWHIS